MARLSLWFGCALQLGCVVTSPDEIAMPTKTRPFLLAEAAKPSVYQVLNIRPEDRDLSIEFRVTLFSEDLGDDLNAIMIVDYDPTFEGRLPIQPIIGETIAPGTLDESRVISRYFVPSRPNPEFLGTGCHTMTMLVSHGGFDLETGRPREPNDVGLQTWWFSMCHPETGECPMTDCPSPEPTQLDAGTVESGS